MSIFRLTVVAATLAVFSSLPFHSSLNAQDCNCQSGEAGRVAIPTMGGCGGGCGFSLFRGNKNNGPCVPSHELWDGFAESQNCKGCVSKNQFKPNFQFGMPCLPGGCSLRGLGFGRSHCQSGCVESHGRAVEPGCGVDQARTFHIPVPYISMKWGRPESNCPEAKSQEAAPEGDQAGFMPLPEQKDAGISQGGESKMKIPPAPVVVEDDLPSLGSLKSNRRGFIRMKR